MVVVHALRAAMRRVVPERTPTPFLGGGCVSPVSSGQVLAKAWLRQKSVLQ